jgi:hypothetical protein
MIYLYAQLHSASLLFLSKTYQRCDISHSGNRMFSHMTLLCDSLSLEEEAADLSSTRFLVLQAMLVYAKLPPSYGTPMDRLSSSNILAIPR